VLAVLRFRSKGARWQSYAFRIARAAAMIVLSTRNHGGASSSWDPVIGSAFAREVVDDETVSMDTV
jgi:hypothetical protein